MRCGLPPASVKKRPREAIQRTPPSRRRTRNSLWNAPDERLSAEKSRTRVSTSAGWMRSRIVAASSVPPAERGGSSKSSAKLSEWTKLSVGIVQSRMASPADSRASCSRSSLADSSASARWRRSRERTSATISRGSIGIGEEGVDEVVGLGIERGLFADALGDPQDEGVAAGLADAAADLSGARLVAAFHDDERWARVGDPGRRGLEVVQLGDLVPRLRDERGDPFAPLQRRADDEDRLPAFHATAPEGGPLRRRDPPIVGRTGTRGGAFTSALHDCARAMSIIPYDDGRSSGRRGLPRGLTRALAFAGSWNLGSGRVAAIAQLVRALDCGSRGPPFEPGWWYQFGLKRRSSQPAHRRPMSTYLAPRPACARLMWVAGWAARQLDRTRDDAEAGDQERSGEKAWLRR